MRAKESYASVALNYMTDGTANATITNLERTDMKKPTLTLLALLALTLTGCGSDSREPNPNLLYSGHHWDVVRLNDSTVVCVPGLNASSKSTPVVINLHDPDCPCREKGGEND